MENVPETALVISAHPDDLDFGCSGTVALWRRSGAKVVYLICTNGDKGTEDQSLSAEELSKIRQREQTEAARVVGVEKLIFLGFEDGELENTLVLRRRLVEAIRRVRPRIVLCQDPAHRTFENVYVSHRDHRAAAEASFDALYPASNNRRFFPELLAKGLEPHQVEEVFFFGTHAPNHWMDITNVIELKLRALFSHSSQVGGFKDFESIIREYFREIGRQAGYEYAEAFRRIALPA
jgi:LmbE family N-acetylglucosaminyl deacetylase